MLKHHVHGPFIQRRPRRFPLVGGCSLRPPSVHCRRRLLPGLAPETRAVGGFPTSSGRVPVQIPSGWPHAKGDASGKDRPCRAGLTTHGETKQTAPSKTNPRPKPQRRKISTQQRRPRATATGSTPTATALGVPLPTLRLARTPRPLAFSTCGP